MDNLDKRPFKRFIPSICKEKTEGDSIKPAEYSGFVELWAPSFEERRAMLMIPEIDEIRKKAKSNKEAGSDEQVSIGEEKSIDLIQKISAILPNWTKDIQITRLEDNVLITKEDLEMFEYDSDMHTVTQEMCGELLGKFKFGNPKTPQS